MAISTWRRSEDVRTPGLIGPNAILQLAPVLDRTVGPEVHAGILARAGLAELPDGSSMIPEDPVARVHRELRRSLPGRAPAMAREAGRRTADYIMAYRIPGPAQALLKILPAPVAARLLSRAIARHAWTFAGSGQFQVCSPYCFEIRHNPMVRGEVADHPLCDWHAAVYARLYQVLVGGALTCRETACSAVHGCACRFELGQF